MKGDCLDGNNDDDSNTWTCRRTNAAKKHSECFKVGQSDGADHPFDASRFDRCGRNYQDGFLKVAEE